VEPNAQGTFGSTDKIHLTLFGKSWSGGIPFGLELDSMPTGMVGLRLVRSSDEAHQVL
jgi:hypothetical protein